mmetsp:Transcript_5402/g.18683  ORF Transcript_5402/g.18683 Transcript_5402/m.18683 type:complete len:231 (-) Transcript_5402:610-1302(-)
MNPRLRAKRLAAWRQLSRSAATVIGPTPPGTGVTAPARAATSSKATSPMTTYSSFSDSSLGSIAARREEEGEGMLLEPLAATGKALMPTSMTTAPGLIQLARTISGRPTAATTTSASRVTLSRSRGQMRGRWSGTSEPPDEAAGAVEPASYHPPAAVPATWWHTVTAAQPLSRSSHAKGRPTTLLLPRTTARLPSRQMSDRLRSSRHPFGVHGTKSGGLPRMASRPTLSG